MASASMLALALALALVGMQGAAALDVGVAMADATPSIAEIGCAARFAIALRAS